MKEWWKEKKEAVKLFFTEYGKVFCIGVLLSTSLVSLLLIVSVISPQKLRVSFLDIGQGDSILIQTPSGKIMLIDGGPTDTVLTRLATEMPYFNKTVDVMVSTHPDADHVTGLIPVLLHYDVKKIIISPSGGHTGVFDDLKKYITLENAEVHTAASGDVIDFQDGVTARILYPAKNYLEKKNDTNHASVSMVVHYGDETFLLTGDLPSNEEPKLIAGGLPPGITVYKAAHHGSKYSSGVQLLTYIKPEYAVISAGKDNKYGHPNPETIERLEKYSKEIISTIDSGTISFYTDGRMINVYKAK